MEREREPKRMPENADDLRDEAFRLLWQMAEERRPAPPPPQKSRQERS
jgi:hypothetical protein